MVLANDRFLEDLSISPGSRVNVIPRILSNLGRL
jgi:hypothetical protein